MGVNNVFVRIYDLGGMYTDVPLMVEVVNNSPYFMYHPLPDMDVPLNTTVKINYSFYVYDFEGNTVLMTAWLVKQDGTLVAAPSFVQ